MSISHNYVNSFGAALLVSLLIPLSTRAQTAPAGSESAQLVRQGVVLRTQGDDTAALESFRRAYELDKSPVALAQIAQAEQALGMWVEAQTHMREALLSHVEWVDKNRPALEAALAVADMHVGSLEVRCEVPGASIYVDEKLMGSAPLGAISLVAGSVVLAVRAEGYHSLTRQVQIAALQTAREVVQLVPLTAERPGASAASAPSLPAATAPDVEIEKLTKLLPLQSLSVPTKLQLVEQFVAAHGADTFMKEPALVASMSGELRSALCASVLADEMTEKQLLVTVGNQPGTSSPFRFRVMAGGREVGKTTAGLQINVKAPACAPKLVIAELSSGVSMDVPVDLENSQVVVFFEHAYINGLRFEAEHLTAKAAVAYEQACAKGESRGCQKAFNMTVALKRACARGDSEACAAVSAIKAGK